MPKSKETELISMKENKMLIDVIMGGFIGSTAGIILGFVLGLLIWWIGQLIATVDPGNGAYSVPPIASSGFLGMGFGAIIGAIFGSIVGLKQRK